MKTAVGTDDGDEEPEESTDRFDFTSAGTQIHQSYVLNTGVLQVGDYTIGSYRSHADDSKALEAAQERRERTARAETLAERRQKFYFDFLKHSLSQAEVTFRLSIWFMAGGAAVILAGAILALVHAGNPDLSYLPLITSLTGALITVGGGALALHARKARAHVTEQAKDINLNINDDHALERAMTFIDRVDGQDARDRLNAVAAMKALDMKPNPETVADRLIPGTGQTQGEIEPGPPNNA